MPRFLLPQFFKCLLLIIIMNWIRKTKEDNLSTIKLKSLRQSLSVTKQVGKSSMPRDKARKALPPGKRISKTGKVYYETRKNRSDSIGSMI